MIRADSQTIKFQTIFTNGEHVSTADTSRDKGGANLGFRPHELLEAALANCMNMYLRMYAEIHNIAISGVSVTVTLDRSRPGDPVFEYSVDIRGDIHPEQKRKMLKALDACPIRTILSNPARCIERQTEPVSK